jgi:pectinesterase
MGPQITGPGWDNWRNPDNEKTAFFAEYKSTGPGAKIEQRVPWSHQLSLGQSQAYSIKGILSGKDNWIVE